MRYASAVERVPRREVVGAIEDQIDAGDEIEKFASLHAPLKGTHLDLGIDGVQGRARGIDLLLAERLAAIEDLPLQVGEIDLVRIRDREAAHAARCEIKRRRTAEAACADDQGMSGAQPFLPLHPDFGEQDVAAIAEKLLVVQFVVAAGLFSATGGGGDFTTGSPLRWLSACAS